MSKKTKAGALLGQMSRNESVATPPEMFSDIQAGLEKASSALGKAGAWDCPPNYKELFTDAHGKMSEAMDACMDAHKNLSEVIGQATTTGEDDKPADDDYTSNAGDNQ